MIDILQSILIGAAIVGGSVAFLFAVDRFWSSESRRQHNDIVGWQISVVGTTYAVIIGFMLYTVWTDYEVARVNVDVEADSLVNVARLAAGLPDEQRKDMQAYSRRYAELMISEEWPAMAQERTSQASKDLIGKLWETALRPETLNGTQQYALNYTISELTEMTEHRRLRESESREGLPGILWTVLAVGAFVTLGSCCLFGTRSFPLHLVQVLGISSLLALALIAVAQIDRPFQGSVRVGPDAFIRAQESLQQPPAFTP